MSFVCCLGGIPPRSASQVVQCSVLIGPPPLSFDIEFLFEEVFLPHRTAILYYCCRWPGARRPLVTLRSRRRTPMRAGHPPTAVGQGSGRGAKKSGDPCKQQNLSWVGQMEAPWVGLHPDAVISSHDAVHAGTAGGCRAHLAAAPRPRPAHGSSPTRASRGKKNGTTFCSRPLSWYSWYPGSAARVCSWRGTGAARDGG